MSVELAALEQTGHSIGFELHFYQPPRRAFHRVLRSISTDPLGKDWTEIIAQQCYGPLSRSGVLGKTSYDIYPTLDLDLQYSNPAVAHRMREHMRTNGVASPYIHTLLPDRSKRDKSIVIGAGVDWFFRKTGVKPKFFWLPETAVDTDTLEVLVDNEIEDVFLAPEQVESVNGESSENTPVRIPLPSGRHIIVIPFDRPLSKALAFDDKYNADEFANNHIPQALGRLNNGFPLVAATDGETFGHHWRKGDRFIQWLVDHSLLDHQVASVAMNTVELQNQSLAEGRIRERTAWSCPHGDLKRWHGDKCPCSEGQGEWKEPFNQALAVLNEGVSEIVANKLGDDHVQIMTKYFDRGFKNPGPPYTNYRFSLISAEASAITGLTSCGTFFKDPHTSGRINILFARQAVQHLQDAGFEREASLLWEKFTDSMREVHDPTNPGKTGVDIVKDLLGELI